MGDVRGLTHETVIPVQPHQARKRYTCPGCRGPIEAGVFHVVVIPDDLVDFRRHWHRGCWFKEQRRKPGP